MVKKRKKGFILLTPEQLAEKRTAIIVTAAKHGGFDWPINRKIEHKAIGIHRNNKDGLTPFSSAAVPGVKITPERSTSIFLDTVESAHEHTKKRHGVVYDRSKNPPGFERQCCLLYTVILQDECRIEVDSRTLDHGVMSREYPWCEYADELNYGLPNNYPGEAVRRKLRADKEHKMKQQQKRYLLGASW